MLEDEEEEEEEEDADELEELEDEEATAIALLELPPPWEAGPAAEPWELPAVRDCLFRPRFLPFCE